MGKRSKKRVLGRGLSVLLGDVDKNTFNEKAQNIDQEVGGKIIELEINRSQHHAFVTVLHLPLQIP